MNAKGFCVSFLSLTAAVSIQICCDQNLCLAVKGCIRYRTEVGYLSFTSLGGNVLPPPSAVLRTVPPGKFYSFISEARTRRCQMLQQAILSRRLNQRAKPTDDIFIEQLPRSISRCRLNVSAGTPSGHRRQSMATVFVSRTSRIFAPSCLSFFEIRTDSS